MPCSRPIRIILIIAALFAFYVAGILVRHRCGIGVIVRNHSAAPLRQMVVRVEYRGKTYPLPDLPPGHSLRVYVQPAGESAIHLEFVDSANHHHDEDLAGYVEDGYSGRTTATVYPDRVDINDDTFAIIYWKSWLDFVW